MDDANFDEFSFVVVVSADADPRDAGPGWTGLVASTEALARPRAGYGGAMWLAQGRVLGPPPTPDTELLMGLLFWRSSRDAEAFAAELVQAQPNSKSIDGLVIDEGIYRFSATVTPNPDDVTHVDPSRTEPEVATEIIRMTPVSGKQGWVGEYNESETRDHIKHLDGFVSASFFRDLRSDRIVECVQWRSPADLTAAFGDARFAEHLSVNSHYSEGEAFLFGERLAGETV
ncbi:MULTISPECIES: hypothetical protein [Mycobacteriaceae]|uniref:ABM domain-containing protein n=1 Tax=Mycolicibacterium neoaurum VKM Ac-1815D TaxID=700508 RepID=V5XJ78_MYCNE|nr:MULTISPECIES: hypothetical protein [Mycobacteriaceae]AHC27978.1 hypothetical protein D174_16650 [Mycolicibacterium neoaurum VKM Ac-1815D]AMO06488.1 hypothetical protein MyAD_16340 [Mycolicibacterium neoaurum]AXK75160.1 hypothetical protein DXK33_08610 [Mycolicibacterium neoaurum]KJQ51151.1 hypothetical protein TS71_07770 [Mycolicibacterium neoaurum]KUM07945.1 hypothetical protein AVZ31_13560 [Mycolicibacterium neoaurum]